MNDIIKHLLKFGFVENNNRYELSQTAQHVIVINGRQQIQETTNVLVVEYIGEGSIEDNIIYGFSIYSETNGKISSDKIDVWGEDWKQFCSLSGIKF